MKELNIITPYDDESLVYNQVSGRYELTLAYCKENFEENFKNDSVLKRRIRENTRTVYYYITTHVATWNKPVVNFLLNRTEQGRKFLLELLDAQMQADILTGYNDTAFMPAINFNGQDKDREEIKRNTICVAAEQIFLDSDSYFGFRIDYHGQFPPYLFMLARNYQ